MKYSVLFLIPTLENGGAEKVMVNLVNNMDLGKYEITVMTIFDYGINKKKLSPNIRYKSFLKKPFKGYSRLIGLLPNRYLYDIIVHDHYDVCISYLEGSAAKIISGCSDANTKKIAWIHTVMDSEKRLKIGFRSKEEAMNTYCKFERIVFVSNSAREAFLKISGMEPDCCRVVYNTNETKKIRQMALEPIQDITIKHDCFNICCVGKITPNKGFDRLAHILKKIKNESLPIHVYAIGNGEQQKEIEQYLKENQLEGSYSFIGFRENPYKYVAACDLYVCASHKEGLSTAVTEALVVGTPVVSTNCSGAYELLGNNNEYGIVTENSEEGLYNGIMQLLSDKSLMQHYKRQSAIRGTMFSTANTVEMVENLIDEALNE